MSERLQAGKCYPLADVVPASVLAELGGERHNVHAIATGEKRPPKRGEWYLSGAVIAAYRAPNDLGDAYHIARLVRTTTEPRATHIRPV